MHNRESDIMNTYVPITLSVPTVNLGVHDPLSFSTILFCSISHELQLSSATISAYMSKRLELFFVCLK